LLVPKPFLDLLVLGFIRRFVLRFSFSPAGCVVVRQAVPTERSGFRFLICKSELAGPYAKLTF
jgi:hypothetical protein